MKDRILILVLFVGVIQAQTVSIQNDYIKAVVNKTTGEFAIGRPDGFALLEGYPDGYLSSHFSIKCDLNTSTNKPGPNALFTLIDTARVWENQYIAIAWEWNNLKVWEKLRLLPEDSLKRFIYIELIVYISTNDSHSIGGMLYLDPILGNSHPHHLFLPTGEFDTVADFSGADVPVYWIGSEDTIFSAGFSDMYMGTFFGVPGVYPDRVVFGNDTQMEGVLWNYSPTRGLISDLGVLIYWNPVRLGGYELYFMGLYYGGGYPRMSVREVNKPITAYLTLSPPAPNPFNSSVKFEYNLNLPFPIKANINIYNSRGQHIRTLFSGLINPGRHQLYWDGQDGYGRALPSGVYFVQLSSGNLREIQKVILLK